MSPPKYGPFKRGDAIHSGYNKTFGHGKTSEETYLEEMEVDSVKYLKNIQKPTWVGNDVQPKSMINDSILNNYRNINQEKSLIGY